MGEVMRAVGLGEVVASKNPKLPGRSDRERPGGLVKLYGRVGRGAVVCRQRR
ncbi:hypothetical protein [Mycobacterium tilburgii]|uniref:hypothetical protein n=1 Tax=Mycobacterium tilburgii TaxID=44467 RepID=UPI002E0ED44B